MNEKCLQTSGFRAGGLGRIRPRNAQLPLSQDEPVGDDATLCIRTPHSYRLARDASITSCFASAGASVASGRSRDRGVTGRRSEHLSLLLDARTPHFLWRRERGMKKGRMMISIVLNSGRSCSIGPSYRVESSAPPDCLMVPAQSLLFHSFAASCPRRLPVPCGDPASPVVHAIGLSAPA